MKKIIYNRGAPIEYGLYGFIRHKKNYHIETYNLATIESRYEKAAIYPPHTHIRLIYRSRRVSPTEGV